MHINISRHQWVIFFTATLGYGLYYLCRLSLSVAKAPLVAAGVLTETQVGIVGSALFYVYAVGKFTNGFLADRVDLRRLLAFGLFGSAVINLILGFKVGFILFVVLWALNGWMQSMGAPACVVALTRWFERGQRGTFYGLWSASHNIGEGLTFLATSTILTIWGWRGGFIASGLVGLVGTALIWIFFRDHPGGAAESSGTTDRKTPAVNEEQWLVLRSPLVWCIALASACMYVTRYAVNSWGVFYFEYARGYTPVKAGGLVAISSVCGVVGTVTSGWISDYFFRGDRFKPAALAGSLTTLSLALMLWSPGTSHILDIVAMVGFGFGIGALVCYLGGLIAVDSVSKNAAGAALGVVGVASYLGAGTQDVLSGWLIGKGKSISGAAPHYDFTVVGACWLAAALGTVALTLLAAWIRNRAARLPDGSGS